MAFKMKGSPIKLGSIKGTAGHTSALKQMKSPAKQKVSQEADPTYEGTDYYGPDMPKMKNTKAAKKAMKEGAAEAMSERITKKAIRKAKKATKKKSPNKHKVQETPGDKTFAAAKSHNETYGTPKHHDTKGVIDRQKFREGTHKTQKSKKRKEKIEKKSPNKQGTRLIDKIKSAGQALAIGAEYGRDSMPSLGLIRDTYKRAKKNARKKRREEAMSKKKKD